MMENEKRIVDYREIKKLFDEQYKKTAELIHNGETHLDNLAEGFLEADRVIARLPTVDAVPVVRCKDCAKDGMTDCPLCYIEKRTLQFINHDAEFFCGFGERKEQE